MMKMMTQKSKRHNESKRKGHPKDVLFLIYLPVELYLQSPTS